jgi:hypothetical protein
MIVCIAEDRTSFEPAIKLLLMSLTDHCGKTEVHLFHPNASNGFSSWLSNQSYVYHHTEPLPNAHEFNVKPQAMLHLLDRGHDNVLWIDSDIIVTSDISTLLNPLDYNTLAIAEEALWTPHDDRAAWRARKWGFKVGRILPFALNSGVVRVTRTHRRLLERWQTLLASTDYREVQQRPWHSRPLHMMGDQDVLTALLTSEEFADIPLKILARGTEIIQYFGPYGYTLRERWSHTFRTGPAFVHSQGPDKPWTTNWQHSSPKQYFNAVYLDLSPYTLAASSYADRMDDDLSWMRAHFVLTSLLRSVGFWRAPLIGLPLAALADFYRKTLRRASNPSHSGLNVSPERSALHSVKSTESGPL